MDRRKKGEYVGALGALLVHVAVIALLILVSFTVPQPDEDAGGIPVMMGNVDAARGFDDPSLVDVDVLDEEAPAQTQPELPSEQDLLTQTEEETVTLKPKTEEPKKETVKPKEVVKPKKPVKKPEKTEAEKAAEAKRLAEAKAERERKAAEEAARKKVAGAFGKGSQMTENKGTSAGGTGTEGSKEGNSSTGAKTGTGGYGTFDLGGRSLGTGSLPKPAYNVQEEGRVVVNITVNPAGQVVATSINPQTNTVNSALRKAAEEAAKKKVANAFGKGAQMGGSKGTSASGTGTEGSKDGNSSTGAKTGTGGYGTFDLGGRSLGTGSLPKPAYNVPEEGRVVVNITVNPAGVVIGTSINPQTNTVNSTLRKAAEDAAKKARFNTVEGPNNQTGTITYYFNLR